MILTIVDVQIFHYSVHLFDFSSDRPWAEIVFFDHKYRWWNKLRVMKIAMPAHWQNHIHIHFFMYPFIFSVKGIVQHYCDRHYSIPFSCLYSKYTASDSFAPTVWRLMLSWGEVTGSHSGCAWDCGLFRGAGGRTVSYSVCIGVYTRICMLWACFRRSRTSRVPEIMWNSWEECRTGVPSCHLTPSLPVLAFLDLDLQGEGWGCT